MPPQPHPPVTPQLINTVQKSSLKRRTQNDGGMEMTLTTDDCGCVSAHSICCVWTLHTLAGIREGRGLVEGRGWGPGVHPHGSGGAVKG